MRKIDLRRRMRMARDLIGDRTLRSLSIWSAIAELDAYRRADIVMAFVGVGGEPDTDSLFARLEADGKTLVLPSVDGARLTPRLVGAGLVAGPLGIPAPQGEHVPPGVIDLVIVPGLAFTVLGERLGQGGGHYDRFLPTLAHSCITVGVCFAEQLVDQLPIEEHDRRMDHVVVDEPVVDEQGLEGLAGLRRER